MITRMCTVNGKCILLNEVSSCEMAGYTEHAFFLEDCWLPSFEFYCLLPLSALPKWALKSLLLINMPFPKTRSKCTPLNYT